LSAKVVALPNTFMVNLGTTSLVTLAFQLEDGSQSAFTPTDFHVTWNVSATEMSQTPSAFVFTAPPTPGDVNLEATIRDEDGDPVNPFDNPLTTLQARVRTAIVKSPAGIAVDAADNFYVSDADNDVVVMVPPTGPGVPLLRGVKRPGDVEIDAKGKSLLVVCADGVVERHYFGLTGVVKDSTGALIVGATITAQCAWADLTGARDPRNNFKTDVDGRFSIFSLLGPEPSPSPRKVAITIEYNGKSQAYVVTLAETGQTVKEFTFTP